MSAIRQRQLQRACRGALRNSASRSHVGLVRSVNEDRIFDSADNRLWAIADGMGGHQGGDLAAQAVIDSLRALVQNARQPSFSDALGALMQANQAIIRHNEANRTSSGATVVLAFWNDSQIHVAWAGDSRAYVLQDSVAKLVTHDHSVVQELIEAGLLTAETAPNHPQANVVTRALGVVSDLAIETISYSPVVGERLMLCSDGLSRSFDPRSVPAMTNIGLLADAMLARALLDDGSDNASVVIVEACG